MRSLHILQLDITLHLDMDGVTQDATFSGVLPQEDLDHRIAGRPWSKTAASLCIQKVAPAALIALGTGRSDTDDGRVALKDLMAADRDAFLAMLGRVRQHRKTPGIFVHFGPDGDPRLVRFVSSTARVELGAEAQVEMSVVGNTGTDSQCFGVLLRERSA